MRPEMKRMVHSLWMFAAVWLCLRYLLPVLLPFALGLGLALAAEPGVRFLNRLGLPRGAAAGIGIAGIFGTLCVLATMVLTFALRELGVLASILPDLESAVRSGLEALQAWLLGLAARTPESVRALLCRNVTEAFSGGTALLDEAVRYGLGMAGTVLTYLPGSALGLGTAVLSAILIAARMPQLQDWLTGWIQTRNLTEAVHTLKQMKNTLGLWLLAQAKLAGVTAVLLCGGFLLLRIGYAPLAALGVAVVDAFPILGTGTVLLPWSLICLLRQDGGRALGLLGLYAVVSLTRSMLEPRFVGRQLGLDPLVTLIAMYTGLKLWGFLGMLLMPLAAMTAVRMGNGGERRI